MTETRAAAFWSYAHEDDRLDDGGILRLADRLQNEYSLMSGQALEVFVDRDGIKWGDEWRPAIDGALARTTFFIPILTPRYFERPECRKEFINFHTAAQSLGVSDLILPVLYAPVAQFDGRNEDELIALASRFQYVDWRQLRLEDSGSTLVKRQVHTLAVRLIEAGQRVDATQVQKEIDAAEGTSEERGVLELVEEIEALLPQWSDSVEGGLVGNAQFKATLALYMPKLARLETSPGQPSAKFALTQRLAVQVLPLMQKKVELAQTYARKSLELDPLITELLRMLEREPGLCELIPRIDQALDEARAPIASWIQQHAEGVATIGIWASKRSHVSRVLRELAQVSLKSEALSREGNEIVLRWLAQRDKIAPHSAAVAESQDDENDGEGETGGEAHGS